MRLPPYTPLVQHWNRTDLIPPVRVDPTGRHGPTRHEVRRDGWRHTSRGLWVPPSADGARVEQRIVEAAAVLPGFGGVTGWAAMRWLGSRWCDGRGPQGDDPLPVRLVVDDIRRPANALISEERLLPGHLIEFDGLVVSIPIRSVTFEMRYAHSFREAVVWFEKAAYDDLVSRDELEAFHSSLNGWTGVPQLRHALRYLEENSWSPAEVRLRLVWVIDAELPDPLCNRPVFDLMGRHVGTPDLLDVEAGLAVQYEGELHTDPDQRIRDLERDERFRDVGIDVVLVTKHDMRDRDRLADRLQQVRRRALDEAPSRRRWTLELPDWWVPTFTVAQRRALDVEQRRVWLRYRDVA